MRVHNSEISEMFEEVADLLEIEGANQFRIVARELEKMSDFTGRLIQGEGTVC